MAEGSNSGHGGNGLFESVQGNLEALRPAERRVAHFVLVNSRRVISMNLGAFAREAGVSAPTAIKFCRSVGCDGFSDLKLQLAQSVAAAPVPAAASLMIEDGAERVADKMFGAAIEALRRQHSGLDRARMTAAADLLAGATRIEIAASGSAFASGLAAAQLMQSYGLASACGLDVRLQRTGAATLGASGALLVLDFGDDGGHGRACAALVAEAGATSVGIGPGSAAGYGDLWFPLQSSAAISLYDHPLHALEAECCLASIAALSAIRSGIHGANRIRRLRAAGGLATDRRKDDGT